VTVQGSKFSPADHLFKYEVEETEPDDEDMVELHVVQADDIKREKGTRPSCSEFFPIPVSNFFPSRSPDPNFFSIPDRRIRIQEYKYFKPKKIVSKLSEM
jgi:hypothetical protein